MADTKSEFLADLERLVASWKSAQPEENTGCVQSTGLTASIDCVFCSDCSRAYRCRYTEKSHDVTNCTYCSGCKQSHGLTYCEECEGCSDSNYLILCRSCIECDYCFACVGLNKKDFHILNKKYSRGDYFRKVTELRKALAMGPPKA